MELKGSKTEANLWIAFAGESQARNKYTYYASKAKKEGYEQIAAIFQETALNEKEHAKLWFKALGGIGSTMENLVAAAAGENEEGLKAGVEMVLRQTKETFAKMGVEEIDPLGQPFDAELHNAVMQGSEDEGEPGTVCMVLQKGYKLGNRVIRHAMVKVVAG